MVDVNVKLLITVVMLNAFLIGMFTVMPDSITDSFSGVKGVATNNTDYSSVPDDYLNGTSIGELGDDGMKSTVSSGWSGIWGFIKFMVLGGVIGVEEIPQWFSIPLFIFMWVLNIMVLIDLIGFVRELIGFT